MNESEVLSSTSWLIIIESQDITEFQESIKSLNFFIDSQIYLLEASTESCIFHVSLNSGYS